MSPGDESVLHAALDAGLSPPYACMQGICGSCRARLVAGEVSMDEAFAITAEEQANGVILVCRSRPTTARLTISFEGGD